MGTTCVAAVLHGKTAYIANVGNSRAYLIRAGQVKQLSQDHSWVAEQLQFGLLTEAQTRSHAQRHILTRCLGTQPDVAIDIFKEMLLSLPHNSNNKQEEGRIVQFCPSYCFYALDSRITASKGHR